MREKSISGILLKHYDCFVRAEDNNPAERDLKEFQDESIVKALKDIKYLPSLRGIFQQVQQHKISSGRAVELLREDIEREIAQYEKN